MDMTEKSSEYYIEETLKVTVATKCMKVSLFRSHPGDNQSPLQALVILQLLNY